MNRNGLMSFLSSVVVLILGLLVGFIVLLISDAPNAPTALFTMLTHGFSNMRIIGNVLLMATPIILTGLSVAFAFKTGLFNIGGTGQFTLGAFVAVYIGLEFNFLPPALRILTAVLAATVAGALWGAIPGLLKALCNVHEVISCIMTNYISMFLVTFLVHRFTFDPFTGRSYRPPSESRLPSLGMENIFVSGRASAVDVGIFIAIGVAILIYIILEKTTFGYELKACGFNRDAAKYAGVNENRNIVFAMMISGGLAGLAGAMAYIGGSGLTLDIVHTLLPEGFTGISVAFLGMNHPIGVIFAGLLISFLTIGGNQIQTVAGFAIEFVQIVIAIIIYFCAFVFLVRHFMGDTFNKLFSKIFKKSDAEEGSAT